MFAHTNSHTQTLFHTHTNSLSLSHDYLQSHVRIRACVSVCMCVLVCTCVYAERAFVKKIHRWRPSSEISDQKYSLCLSLSHIQRNSLTLSHTRIDRRPRHPTPTFRHTQTDGNPDSPTRPNTFKYRPPTHTSRSHTQIRFLSHTNCRIHQFSLTHTDQQHQQPYQAEQVQIMTLSPP